MAQITPVAGNGLLDRRAFLRASGILITGYVVSPAAAEPLADAPWSKEPGMLMPAYGVPSQFEKDVAAHADAIRKASRATQHARTPHHLLNGHDHAERPALRHLARRRRPTSIRAQHRLVIHGLVKRPLVFTLDALERYPMVSRIGVRRMRRQQRAALLERADAGQRAGAARPRLVRRVDWRACSRRLLEEAGIDPKAKWIIAEGADSLAPEPQRPARQGARRRDDRAVPERRAADARQRLSDAPAAARLGRQHERQVAAPDQAHRRRRR